MPKIFGRRRVPKIAQGLGMFIYYALEAQRGIPVDGPVLLALFEPDREAGGYVVTLPDFG